MPIISEDCNSLSELVEKVSGISDQRQNLNQLWFRGHSCSEYRLVPALMRDEKTWDQVFERETRLLVRFRQRSLPYWPSGYPQTQWEHLFVMQHHGLPTRLLDWSENLLISSYFALGKHDHEGGGCSPVLWAFDPVAWNSKVLEPMRGPKSGILNTADEESDSYEPGTSRKMWTRPVAIYGTHNSANIVAQRGTFVVWGTSLDSMEQIAELSTGPDLWKFNLSGDMGRWRSDLRLVGVQETTVFPNLGALAQEIGRMEAWNND